RVYSQVRDQTPISTVESFGGRTAFFISHYDDVVSVLKDPRFSNEQSKVGDGSKFSESWWMPNVFRALLNSMVMVDDPDHGRLRTLVHKAFTPRMIQQMGVRIEEI